MRVGYANCLLNQPKPDKKIFKITNKKTNKDICLKNSIKK